MEKMYLNTLNKELAKGGGIAFSGILIQKILGFAFSIMVARVLGAADYGLYALGISIIGITQSIASLGLNQGIVRFCAVYRVTGDTIRVKSTFLTALVISFISSVLMAAILFILSSMIAHSFFHKPELTWILRVFALALPFYVLMGLTASFAQSFRRIDYQQGILNFFYPLVNLILVVLLFALGFHLAGPVYAFLISGFLSAGLGFYLSLKLFPEIIARSAIVFNFRKLLRFSMPVFLSGFLYLSLNNIDRIMLGYLTSAAEVGIYSVAARIALLLNFILMAFIHISSPIMAELHGTSKFTQLARLYHTMTRWILTLSLPLFLFVVFASKSIMQIFGSEFIAGSSALIVLASAQLFNAGTGPIGKLLEMTGKQDINLAVLLIIIIMNIGLNIWLIPLYGATGAAIATSASIIITFGVLAIISRWLVGFHIYDRLYFRPIFIAAIAATIGILSGSTVRLTVYGVNIFKISGVLLIYAVLIWRFGLVPADRILLGLLKREVFQTFLKRRNSRYG